MLRYFDSYSGVVSFYLSLILQTVGITSVTQQTLLNGFLNVWNLILAIGAATLIDKAGRRKLFLLSCSIMLFAYVVFTALSGTFAKNQVKSVGIAVRMPRLAPVSDHSLIQTCLGDSIPFHLLWWVLHRLFRGERRVCCRNLAQRHASPRSGHVHDDDQRCPDF
jgi:MFS family permease